MNFKDLLKNYELDITITRENVFEKLYLVPVLHGKYHKYLYQWRRLLLKIEQEKIEKYREKYYYYKDDFDRTLDEKQIKWHIETDEEYVSINQRYLNIKNEVDQIEQMVKHCGNLSFFCQNIISWEAFLSGR